jgi:tetratricopeptide (TPR) repeat protein
VKNLSRALVICIFIACNFFGFAQKSDTTIIRKLHARTNFIWSTYPDSILIYRDSALQLAISINDHVGVAESFRDLGIYHWIKGNYALAISAYDTSNLILDHANRSDLKYINLSNLGMVYSKLGDFPKAIDLFIQALHYAEKNGNKSIQGKIMNSLGVAYKSYGNSSEALNCYNRALELFTELQQPENIAGCYANIGEIYFLRKDAKKALQIQLKSLAIFDSLNNPKGKLSCYNNISEIQLALNNDAEALVYGEKALKLSREKLFFSNEISSLFNIGSAHTKLENFELAIQNYLEAIELAEKNGSRNELLRLYSGLSNCYKLSGMTGQALLYYEKYAVLKDSVFNQQSLSTISNLQISYDLDKKEAAIELLQKENRINTLSRNRMIVVFIMLLIISGLVVALQRIKISKDRLLKSHEEKLRASENALVQTELKLAQIKEAELRKDLDYKNRSITTYALSIVQKNEVLEEVRESIHSILKNPNDQAKHFHKLAGAIDASFRNDKDWDEFKKYFEEVNSDFFVRLKEIQPDLTSSESRLCSLIRLDLNVKQAATILRIAPDSVKIARHRLRKKFNLQTEENLNYFIMAI